MKFSQNNCSLLVYPSIQTLESQICLPKMDARARRITREMMETDETLYLLYHGFISMER